jgi:hypothetical protein
MKDMAEVEKLPVIGASEVQRLSMLFAEELEGQLEKLNKDFRSRMDEQTLDEAERYTKHLAAKGYIFHKPARSKLLFASMFCTYMASHYVIVPK